MTFYEGDDCDGLSYTLALFEEHCWGDNWYEGKKCTGKVNLDRWVAKAAYDDYTASSILNPEDINSVRIPAGLQLTFYDKDA